MNKAIVMSESRVQQLLDRAEISDVVMRYAAGMDFQDWRLFRSCLMDALEIDYSEATGQPPTTVKADDFVARIRKLLSAEDLRTQTLNSNLSITFKRDAAICISYYVAQHYLPNPDIDGGETFNVHGWYTFNLVRTEYGWKISKIKETVRWVTGAPTMLKF
jgi:hypothetical protein